MLKSFQKKYKYQLYTECRKWQPRIFIGTCTNKLDQALLENVLHHTVNEHIVTIFGVHVVESQ